MSDQIFKILSIDGGGIRGVFPAHILCCMTHRLGINLGVQFNMIAGTSTGSIVAAAIACKIDPMIVESMYREYGPEIFSRKKSLLPAKYQPAIQSLYNNEYLKTILENIFKDIKLGEITTPLLLPATDIGNGGVHVFKSGYSKDFTRDKEVLLRDAVLASCSAPTYFNPIKFREYLLADGGLWANNPSLAAVIDAQHRLNINLSDIRILSMGTGLAKTCYGVESGKKWGLLNGWRGKEFISFMMSLQAQATHNYLQLMLQKRQLLRLDFESELPLPLDDCSSIDDLISRADRVFTYNSSEIRDFIT
jgi:hypothetical protein